MNKVFKMFLGIILSIFSYSLLINNAYSANLIVSKILNNTDDKVFVSDYHWLKDGTKYIIIVTKNYDGKYTLYYLTYDKNKEIFIVKRKYQLYNKNFYKSNLMFFENGFLYIEADNDNNEIMYYDNKRKYTLSEDLIKKYFVSDFVENNNGKSIVYGIHLEGNDGIFTVQTNNLIQKILLGFIKSVGNNKSFDYKDGKFIFYNISLSKSYSSVKNYAFDEKVSSFGYNNVICNKDFQTHNFILTFDLNTKKPNILVLENNKGNRICYYSQKNSSLSAKNIFANLDKNKELLLTQTPDLNNGDNILDIYLLNFGGVKVIGKKIYSTKVKDIVNFNNNLIVEKDFKKKFYNANKYANLYEDNNFILLYFKKNDYNTILIYNKRTEEVTEFKDIKQLKKISSDFFNGKYFVKIFYNKELLGIKKLQITSISDNDTIKNLVTLPAEVNVLNIYDGIFTNILGVIGRKTLYYTYLGYYNVVGKLLFTQKKDFFLDYSLDKGKFKYIVVNKKNLTNYFNKFLENLKIKEGIEINKIGSIKILDNGFVLFTVEVSKEIYKDGKKKEIKSKKTILFNGIKIFELKLGEKSSIKNVLIFPIAKKILVVTKDGVYFGSTENGNLTKINISDEDLIYLSTGKPITTILQKPASELGKNIYLNIKNNYLYIITGNKVRKISLTSGKGKTIIEGNIQEIYNYNGHIILYITDNSSNNQLFVDYQSIIKGNFLGIKINDNVIFLFNKKDLILVSIKKILKEDKIKKFNKIVDNYIYSLNNPVVLYYYNLYKDVIYRLNNVKDDKNIIMNLFYYMYLVGKFNP